MTPGAPKRVPVYNPASVPGFFVRIMGFSLAAPRPTPGAAVIRVATLRGGFIQKECLCVITRSFC